MKNTLRPLFTTFVALTVVTGLIYPLLVTGVARAAFSQPASGSLIMRNGKAIGSELIGQQFDAPQYLWGRLSATTPNPYNAQDSAGSNLGPTNPALADEVRGRLSALHAADPSNTAEVPVDLVTSSGSGLDPQISPAAAAYQIPRIARARKLSIDQVQQTIQRYTNGRQLGVLGEARVNVLQVNIALDDLKPAR
ncbi:MAG: potassium-transporting ATPase subunit KdpC [Janthinobacterium lividum]